MEVLVLFFLPAVALAAAAGSVGFLWADSGKRADDRRRLLEKEDQLTEVIKSLQEAHNGLMLRSQAVEDQLSAVQMNLAGRVKETGTNPTERRGPRIPSVRKGER